MFANLVVLASIISATMAASIRDRSYYEEKFFNWMSTHNLKPENGAKFIQWLENFASNDDHIETHNAGNHTFTLGHNKFSHMSIDEWRTYVKVGVNRPKESEAPASIHGPSATANPTSVDWVAAGAVTGVKDQGQCGSCWSFSTTGAIEGAYFNKNKKLVSWSEENLVDCDNRKNGGSDMGCNGGWMDDAFTWVKKNGGICTEADYPYTAGSGSAGTCSDSKCKNSGAAPVSFTDVTPNSDAAFESAVAKQPVSVAIEADQREFQLYKSGVFSAACGTNLDHGVLAVGYGSENGQRYWKVKNSWGTGWGQGGYILLARDVSQKEGQCGIYSAASYPNF